MYQQIIDLADNNTRVTVIVSMGRERYATFYNCIVGIMAYGHDRSPVFFGTSLAPREGGSLNCLVCDITKVWSDELGTRVFVEIGV